MNKIKPDKQAAILSALVEGNSIRSVERMTGTHRDTIMRLGVHAGAACGAYLDEHVRGLDCTRLEVDEIWSFVAKKQGHLLEGDDKDRVGDQWTWIALDPDSKLVPTFKVGKRTKAMAEHFVEDLSTRVHNRVQISSDHLRHYVGAVRKAFGVDVDYGQIVKTYTTDRIGPGRYSPPKVKRIDKKNVIGSPDRSLISTSLVERQNLTMRMSMRRFTRLTNGFSKKVENLRAAVALHFGYYNLVRKHSTIKTTPAVASGVEDHEWDLRELVDMIGW